MENSVQVLILATSLNPDSNSRALARYALEVLQNRGVNVEWLDVQEIGELPLAGSPSSWEPHPGVDLLKSKVTAATHLLFSVPIYNFAGNAVSKNLIELLGMDEIGGKTVGFLCAAGGQRSYMSILSLANSLMLDFRCWIVPRFVYATGADITEGVVTSDEMKKRIEQLTVEMFERIPTKA